MTKVRSEINEYGDLFWFKEGTDILHREDGPAVEYADGTKFWFQNGLLHRLNGPAVELLNGDKEYYLNDIYYSEIKTNEEWIIFQIIN